MERTEDCGENLNRSDFRTISSSCKCKNLDNKLKSCDLEEQFCTLKTPAHFPLVSKFTDSLHRLGDPSADWRTSCVAGWGCQRSGSWWLAGGRTGPCMQSCSAPTHRHSASHSCNVWPPDSLPCPSRPDPFLPRRLLRDRYLKGEDYQIMAQLFSCK